MLRWSVFGGTHRWSGLPLRGNAACMLKYGLANTHTGCLDGDRIGMLLDLDTGGTTIVRNKERLGVMATGLTGEHCWAVSRMWNSTKGGLRASTPSCAPSPDCG